jgi:glutamate-5-semialdehyde dehydrogenase
MSLKDTVMKSLEAAKAASRILSGASTPMKNDAIRRMREGLLASETMILKANAEDMAQARSAGMSGSMLKRLELNSEKLRGMAEGLQLVESFADPVGQGLAMWKRPNGLQIEKIRVPIGVVAVIYESRPNVTTDVAALCLKSGNAVVLRGGKEALGTNRTVAGILIQAIQAAGLPKDAIQFIDTPDREAVGHILGAVGLVDVVIPRGGESLIRAIVEQSKVPVIYQAKGVCHTFIDASADLAMALSIALNAKTTNPAVCNAMECLLVHRSVAASFLPQLEEAMTAKGVELRGDAEACRLMAKAHAAASDDWGKEFSDLILAVRVVDSLEQALEHIEQYGSGHSEAIVTNDYGNTRVFQQRVDAACVYVNASTRFTDGGEFGFGAEVGISTQKLHARGPMGLEELTTVKYTILGSGQVR